MPDEREHVLSTECWCRPIIDSYGAEYVYDERGEVVAGGETDDNQEQATLE